MGRPPKTDSIRQFMGFRVPPRLRSQLEELARREKVSVAAVIRRACRLLLAEPSAGQKP